MDSSISHYPGRNNPYVQTNITSATQNGSEKRNAVIGYNRRGAVLNSVTRRPSRLIVQKESKSEYWKTVADSVPTHSSGQKISAEELNSVISRAMSLGIVGDRKQRESMSAPKTDDLLKHMKDQMEQKVKELTGKSINVDLLGAQNATLMDKVLSLEKALSALEVSKTQQEEEEKHKIHNKITVLEKTLRALEEQKNEQRELNRKTMKMDIDNLKEMIGKMQKNQQQNTSSDTNKDLAQKMARLEAAMRLIHQEKTNKIEDKETILLKRKLALFEQKLKDMEEEKKLNENVDETHQLRDKLTIMEDKLIKMENRKSMSLSQMMQQKMESVEKQLSLLKSERMSGKHNDTVNPKIQEKMASLEKQLREMADQKITPALINDEETVAMREHIKKLESNIMMAEKRMEEQKQKYEEERKLNHARKLKEDEEFRRQAKLNEQRLHIRMQEIEKKFENPRSANNSSLLERLNKLEKGDHEVFAQKIAEMERKLVETQTELQKERKFTRDILENPKEGNYDMLQNKQIAWLMEKNEELVKKLENTHKLIDNKMDEFKRLQINGGGTAVHKSGLSYDDINQKLAEIQAQLFNPDTDEREVEKLNIEYEKFIQELEQTSEYQKEQELVKENWKKENTSANEAAFTKVKKQIELMGDQQITAIFSRKPELRLLLRSPEQILKLHESDFRQLSTQALTLEEARALYHNMPIFKKEQVKQVEWVQQLQTKIEEEIRKPPKNAPPPIAPKKKIVIKKQTGGGGGFLDELIKKRKQRN